MALISVVIIIHIVVALCIIGLVLLQHGKGADAGAAFGSGASGTVFGAAGKSNFLARTTKWLVVMFFLTSFSLMVLVNQSTSVTEKSVLDIPETSLIPIIDE